MHTHVPLDTRHHRLECGSNATWTHAKDPERPTAAICFSIVSVLDLLMTILVVSANALLRKNRYQRTLRVGPWQVGTTLAATNRENLRVCRNPWFNK